MELYLGIMADLGGGIFWMVMDWYGFVDVDFL